MTTKTKYTFWNTETKLTVVVRAWDQTGAWEQLRFALELRQNDPTPTEWKLNRIELK